MRHQLMLRIWSIAAISGLGVVGLSSCSLNPSEGDPVRVTETEPSSSPAAEVAQAEELEAEHTDVPVPSVDAEGAEASVTAAEVVMVRFAQPTLAREDWWQGLIPLLSEKGAYNYELVVPSSVPASKVTGSGALLDGANDYMTLVKVPTDAGPYIVTLTRTSTDSDWLAERIRPAGN